MRCLLFNSCLLVLIGCSSPYKNFQSKTGNITAVEKFRPSFTVALYKAQVNITGNYLSGLLLIKKMPDSSTRLLFSNEMGFKFFDFEFSKTGAFRVYYILKKMDRKAVIKTLRKDFSLLLMEQHDNHNGYIRENNNLLYYIFPQTKGFNCYITDSSGNQLIRMERASKRKAVVTIIADQYVNGLLDTINIVHHNFNFTIGLKKLRQ